MGSLDKENKWKPQHVEIRSRPSMWLLYMLEGAGRETAREGESRETRHRDHIVAKNQKGGAVSTVEGEWCAHGEGRGKKGAAERGSSTGGGFPSREKASCG